MKSDCRWLNDVECPYVWGCEECDVCSQYESDIHFSDCRCPDCEADRGDYLYHMRKDMREI